MIAAPIPTSYNGASGGLKEASNWIVSEDFVEGTEKSVVIQDVELYLNYKHPDGKTTAKLPALRFEKTDKRLKLNASNRKTLVLLFGTNTGNWRGKRVALFLDPNVRFGGKAVGGVRLRMAPALATTTQQAATP